MRVDLTGGTVRVEPAPGAYRALGGRALTSRIVVDETDPSCDPLGPNNPLVWAPGLLSGTTLSSSNRISVGCKSPLTGGIKESNAGGETGLYLAQAGYQAIVVTGAAARGTWQVLVVDERGGRLETAPPESMGVGTYATAAALFARYGRDCALAICGPAGEQLMSIAGIANTDREGRPARLNARGGVGAVMGAKGLKAIVVMGDRKGSVKAERPEQWRDGMRGYHKGLREHPATAKRYPEFGTAGTLEVVNALGGLPTRNFTNGRFEAVDAISGAHMRDLIRERGGDGLTTHACMTGCAIRCSNVFADAAGREVASSMEYETNGLFGSNLGIADLDAIARFTYLCNDLGADTIEAGGAIGIAMEAGLLPWGDATGVERLLDQEVRRATLLGRVIGQGAGTAGRVWGITRVPTVKNQTISAYDPRAIKGNGVTYATSPMGADHTAGNTIGVKTDHLDPAGKVAISRELQIQTALLDTLGFCAFARGLIDTTRDSFVMLVGARLGQAWTWADLHRFGLELIRAEVGFNRAAGLGPATDQLPEWLRTEPLPPHGAVFDVPQGELAAIWDDE